ncbi:MAG: aldo/keto reductase [Thermodesulfovibrionia bacterium]|nr:aldo/keto reductase [Thermodesulfovibrionia bacterium]
MNPLVLGTAQFGSVYGIANKTGQPGQAAATAIVHEAWKNGIREFDTAQGYGTSEEVLGMALNELGLTKEARVISKFHPDLDHLNPSAMSKAVDGSLMRLGVPHLFGIMLHREEMLSLLDKGLSDILHDIVSSGKVQHAGVSVYSPEKAVQALNTAGIDMVQLPSNILDRRFEKAGVFELADRMGKKIYIRSVFLQGLILMDPAEMPDKMAYARTVIHKLRSLSADAGLSRQELALGYIRTEMPDAGIVFGADTPEQVRGSLACREITLPASLVSAIKKTFDDVDEKILNPSLWPN